MKSVKTPDVEAQIACLPPIDLRLPADMPSILSLNISGALLADGFDPKDVEQEKKEKSYAIYGIICMIL
jgi:hypothetical protein